ncbi:MAG: 5-formyltetrahydrofolate cyclo-ligase, partial [Gammaproteobacteria bacterium]
MNKSNKTIIRDSFLKRRQLRNEKENERDSQKIYQNIIASDFFKNAKHIACYFDVKGEVSSKSLIEKIWQEGKHCYFPSIYNVTMKFMHYVSNTELKKNLNDIK